MSSGGQSGTLRHEPIILADGRRVTHSVTSTEDGRIVGHLSRMADLKDLKRDGSGARYAAVRLNYTVSKDRDSMVLDGNSVAYVDMSGEAPEFVNLERIEKNARRVLISPSGLPEAILRFANEQTSPHAICVIDNAPLGEVLIDMVASMGLKGRIMIFCRNFSAWLRTR